MENIPAVANNKALVNNAEFVKLTIYNEYANTANNNVYTFSSSYQSEDIGGQIYTPLGGLLGVGIQQRDIRVTSADTSISLSGIPSDGSDNMAIVLGTKIRGSKVEIIRGFYNTNYVLTSVAQRFTGIVTSYNITEERHDLVDNFTITLNASSYKNVLENRVAGRKTNGESWKVFYPTDTSMDNVYSLADQYFDFGVKPKQGASTQSAASSSTNQASQVSQVTSRGPR
jgi:hypothetical protein